MCPGPRKPPAMATPTPTPMPMPKQEPAWSSLLELAADDNLAAFRRAVQEDTLSLVAASAWYGPSAKCPSRLALELRTPAMVAALYGSTAVLSYVLSIAPSEAARASATDGATPLYLATAGGAASSIAATHLLLAAGESPDAHASSGLRASDLLPRSTPADEPIRLLLKSPAASPSSSPTYKKEEREKQEMKKEHGHPELPDLNSGVFCTDEFRMYSFKVKPCSRAYTHDWTECPFAHPGENARRRDPRRFSYSCVPCPDFRKSPASCRKGDACEYAHGVFESWLHPAQYRTRLCKDEVGCPRRICFFAHRPEELRAVNPSAVSVAMPSPHSSSLPPNLPSGLDMARVAMLTGASRPVLNAPLSSRELDFDLDQYKHKLLLGSSAAAASPLAPRTAPDYSDLLGSVSQLQAPALRQARDINMPAYGCLPEAQMHSAHRPPPGRPMVGGHSMAKAIMSSRASAFAKRSQSFVDRAPAARSFVSPPATTSALSDWGSPDGRLDWSVQGAELRKSASFGIRSAQTTNYATPDVSWVNSLVKDGSDILAAHWSDLEQMVA